MNCIRYYNDTSQCSSTCIQEQIHSLKHLWMKVKTLGKDTYDSVQKLYYKVIELKTRLATSFNARWSQHQILFLVPSRQIHPSNSDIDMFSKYSEYNSLTCCCCTRIKMINLVIFIFLNI